MRKSAVIRNEDIVSSKVILISVGGKSLGEKTLDEALLMAKNYSLDLVAVKEGDVPTCKLMDYSKNKYKKQKHNKPKRLKSKEVRFGINIAEHDSNVKTKHVKQFLEKGYFVKIVLQMYGRHSKSNEELEEMLKSILDKIDFEYRKEERINKNKRMWSIGLSP